MTLIAVVEESCDDVLHLPSPPLILQEASDNYSCHILVIYPLRCSVSALNLSNRDHISPRLAAYPLVTGASSASSQIATMYARNLVLTAFGLTVTFLALSSVSAAPLINAEASIIKNYVRVPALHCDITSISPECVCTPTGECARR